MAYVAATPVSEAPSNIISRALMALYRGLSLAAESDFRLRRIQALQAKSDAELAELGIKREDIVRKVFADLYYI